MAENKPTVSSSKKLMIAASPPAFVLLWSTGFLGAKFGMPHAEPFTFLAYRFALTAVLFAIIVTIMRVPWPRDRHTWIHAAIVGLLMHGVYLAAVFFSIDNGTSGGVAALIVGVQPILTAVFAGMVLSERLSIKAWFGLVLGFIGITLVVWQQAGDTGGWLGITSCVIGLIGVTIATLYQKRFGTAIDLRVGSTIQFGAAAILLWICAFSFETLQIEWNREVIFAMAWLVLVLSFGAVTLLYVLIRRGAASKVASLFYLVPPAVAIETYFLFGETMSPMALVGMGVAVVGVALVTRG